MGANTSFYNFPAVNSAFIICQISTSRRSSTETYLLRDFVYAPLPCKENGCRKDTLGQLTANALIKTMNALFL